jgi:hypothetical protein
MLLVLTYLEFLDGLAGTAWLSCCKYACGVTPVPECSCSQSCAVMLPFSKVSACTDFLPLDHSSRYNMAHT